MMIQHHSIRSVQFDLIAYLTFFHLNNFIFLHFNAI